MEDSNSLFTTAEREAHRIEEYPLLQIAKTGNKFPLLEFWANKRRVFQIRTRGLRMP